MKGLVIADLRHRTGVFVGTFVAVGFGAALFSLCAALFTSAIILNGESSEDYVGPIAVFATMGAISVFASLFVVASTVALSVEQRRADMALLRSVGATPRQVRRLVIREMGVVSLVATVIGTLAALPVADAMAGVFAGIDDMPSEFEYRRHILPVGVSLAATWLVAVLAAVSSARAAGAASPSEAMTGSDGAPRRLGITRWVIGSIFTAGGLALIIVSATTNDDPGLAIGYVFMASATALIGVSMLGPVVVRPMARLVSLPFRAATTGSIAAMNVVADARRTAATAGPVALMMAINVGMVQATVAANDMGTEGSQMWSLWIMIAISVGFAAIAVVNTTAMTIVRRRTELASLRLAGATPAQTRRSSQTEAVIAALTGSAIGVVIATAACWAFAVATGVSLIGMFEPALIGGLAGFAMVLAAGSAHVAARRAIGDPTLLVEVE